MRTKHRRLTVLSFLAIGWATAAWSDGKESTSLDPPSAAGPLVIIGGAEDRRGEILREFVRMSGGEKARLVVLAVASREAEAAGARYVERFLRLGAASVQVLRVAEERDADEPRFLDVLATATGVFFTGGDQRRITGRMRGAEMHRTLQDRQRDGLVLGGTSAGAAMMSRWMIARGEGRATPAMDVVEVEKGMTFIDGALIDQHFSERGRLGRLLSALAGRRARLGIGIDENTALVVESDRFRVLGDGAVTLLDLTDARRRVADRRGGKIALFGVKASVIPAGFSFRFENGEPVPGGDDTGFRFPNR